MPHRASPAATPPAAPGAFVTREVDGGALGARRYTLYVPGGAARGARPLVVLLHGCTQDPADLARGTRIAEHAERDGLLVLLPEQPAGANAKKCWNWYDPAHQRRDAGEPALVAAMTRAVMRERPVDPARVYLAGISAGGAMAVNTALAYPELYAALGVHSGIALGAARDVVSAVAAMQRGATAPLGGAAAAVPAIVFHGTADAVVAPVNGRQVVQQLLAGGGERRDVQRGERNGRRYERVAYHAAAPRAVEEWVVEGLGHAWSGGSPEGTFTDPQGPDATAEMLRFFAAHPRAAAGAPAGGAAR